MGRVTHCVVAGLLGFSWLAGCDKNSSEGVALSGATSDSAVMPAGHPPVGGEAKSEGKSIEGTVAETMDVAGYTYLHIDAKSGKVWAAVPRAELKVGDEVTVAQAMPMKNFDSPSLKRQFDLIYFGVLGGEAKMNPHKAGGLGADPSAGSALPIPDDIDVEKATGANAHTVQEVFAKAKDLSGQEVTVRGVVVKVNKRIMGKNWIHLRDGTGSTAEKNHDLVITSQQLPQLGATVVMAGKVATDKDFGSGYAYRVLVEEATFEAEGGK